jgi:5-methylcytosine-specific restriction enzyme A
MRHNRSLRNQPWSRDELILALKVYCDMKPSVPGPGRPEVQELSLLLRHVERRNGGAVSDDFRSTASIVMKLMNFRSLDSDYAGRGLVSVSEQDRLVWRELSAKPDLLSGLVEAIRLGYASGEYPTHLDHGTEAEAFDGGLLTRLHLLCERDRGIVEEKKHTASKSEAGLSCEVCAFDFAAFYCDRGQGFIECHHIVPLHTLRAGQRTRLADLALVCANCHRMLHASRPVATLAQLRSELVKSGPNPADIQGIRR